ncbi:MAG: hypothetical protein JXB36_07675, partial [Gammaproteobacteria bacterium]|nr:hypothetical protein [Gammaproteobacteria bacterium]
RLSVGPPDARLQRTWGVAAWRPAFTEYLHACVERAIARAGRGEVPEASMGSVVQRAIDSGLSVEAVTVCDSPYLDIGTPQGLLEAQRRAAADPPALLGHFRGQRT